jgi:glycosyltransferase involved in cell wall biosynthesis
MRILIICFDFPPVNRVASLRPYGMARYWSRAGAEVKILTTRRHRPGVPLNRDDVYSDLGEFEVLEADHQKWMFWLPREQAPVSDASPSPATETTPGSARRLSFITRIKKAGLTLVRAVKAGSFFCPTNTWTRPATRAAIDLHRRWPFEIVVSSFGPAACHAIAARLHRRLPFFWVADYRDLWGGSDLLPVRWPFTALETWREKHTVAAADMLSSVSQPLVDHLQATFPNKRVLLVENGFDKEDERELLSPSTGPAVGDRPADRPVKLVYCGALALNHRSPDPLLEPLARLKARRPDLLKHLEVTFHTTHRDFLREHIRKWGLQDVVRDGGYLTRREVLRAQRESDVLIFLEWNNPSSRGILTGKLSEYLNAGVPILCIGGARESDASALIERHGFGVAFGSDVDGAEKFLERLASGEKPAYSPDLSLLARFDRRRQMESFLSQILQAHAASQQLPLRPPLPHPVAP